MNHTPRNPLGLRGFFFWHAVCIPKGMKNVCPSCHGVVIAAMLLAVLPPAVVAGGQDANSPLDSNAPSTVAATTQPAQGTTSRRSEDKPLLFRDDPNTVGPRTGGPDMLSRIVGAIIMVGLLGVIAWIAVKKFMPRIGLQGGKRLQVQETAYLGPKKCLHLVKVGEQEFLVGSTPERVSLLSEVRPAEPEEPARFTLPETDEPTQEGAE